MDAVSESNRFWGFSPLSAAVPGIENASVAHKLSRGGRSAQQAAE